MRSRYAAHVLKNIDHIERSTTGAARKAFDRAETERFLAEADWQGLVIHAATAGGPDDATGQVDFTYSYRHKGRLIELREVGDFCRVEGRWLYKDGHAPKETPIQVDHVGRNDPCPCGSGKKYKKCCGA
jgi:SEC-C motif-containing protein